MIRNLGTYLTINLPSYGLSLLVHQNKLGYGKQERKIRFELIN